MLLHRPTISRNPYPPLQPVSDFQKSVWCNLYGIVTKPKGCICVLQYTNSNIFVQGFLKVCLYRHKCQCHTVLAIKIHYEMIKSTNDDKVSWRRPLMAGQPWWGADLTSSDLNNWRITTHWVEIIHFTQLLRWLAHCFPDGLQTSLAAFPSSPLPYSTIGISMQIQSYCYYSNLSPSMGLLRKSSVLIHHQGVLHHHPILTPNVLI